MDKRIIIAVTLLAIVIGGCALFSKPNWNDVPPVYGCQDLQDFGCANSAAPQ
jgi:hypothetical protein